MEEFWKVGLSGFLPSRPVAKLEELGEACEMLREHLNAYEELPSLLQNGQDVRMRLQTLPLVEIVFAYENFRENSCLLIEDNSYVVAENIFSLFAILASAYVHADAVEIVGSEQGSDLPVILPACISVPLKALAEHVGRKPILDYAGCVLTNWELKEPEKLMTLDNIKILRTFTRTRAEEWFFIIHVMIEYHGGLVMDSILRMRENTLKWQKQSSFEERTKAIRSIISSLGHMTSGLREMNSAMDKMKFFCKPEDFFNIIRPWLAGWKPEGVVYSTKDAFDLSPEHYTGGSGAQSSIMVCVDAFMGITHGGAQVSSETASPPPPEGNDSSNAKGFKSSSASTSADPVKIEAGSSEARHQFIKALKKYRAYMPPPHRKLINELEDENAKSIRDFIREMEVAKEAFDVNKRSANLPVVEAEQFELQSRNLLKQIDSCKIQYNRVIREVISFRRKHIGFAVSYISVQAKKRAEAMSEQGSGSALLAKSKKGTGGSPFKYHLMQHIQDTLACEYEVASEAISPPYRSRPSHVLPGLGQFLPENTVFGRPIGRERVEN